MAATRPRDAASPLERQVVRSATEASSRTRSTRDRSPAAEKAAIHAERHRAAAAAASDAAVASGAATATTVVGDDISALRNDGQSAPACGARAAAPYGCAHAANADRESSFAGLEAETGDLRLCV